MRMGSVEEAKQAIKMFNGSVSVVCDLDLIILHKLVLVTLSDVM